MENLIKQTKSIEKVRKILELAAMEIEDLCLLLENDEHINYTTLTNTEIVTQLNVLLEKLAFLSATAHIDTDQRNLVHSEIIAARRKRTKAGF